ncbi:MAG: PhzF family phenazine biosynthesis protein [Chloroflexi bacterium]|nr:MAG: PhzF family phenazine biosynthesis protein [Chloroflexota bacterium]
MKRTFPFMQVDAFTERPLAGNPCAILFDTEFLSDVQMLAIAKEMNLSETSFVRRSEVADVAARYFTPEQEIPLAGHPTIATIFGLIESGRLVLTGEVTQISLELQVGPIPIEIFAQDGAVTRIVMSQKKPVFMDTHDPAVVMPVFNLTPDDLLPNAPIQTVSTGTPQLMIPVRDLDVLRRVRMNIDGYDALRKTADFFSPHLFCLQGVTEAGHTFARHYGTPPDTMEDPFTGSATGGMAAYLWHHGLLDEPVFIAEQGHWMNRPGQAFVEVVGPRDGIETVKVGGTAVTVVKGEMQI